MWYGTVVLLIRRENEVRTPGSTIRGSGPMGIGRDFRRLASLGFPLACLARKLRIAVKNRIKLPRSRVETFAASFFSPFPLFFFLFFCRASSFNPRDPCSSYSIHQSIDIESRCLPLLSHATFFTFPFVFRYSVFLVSRTFAKHLFTASYPSFSLTQIFNQKFALFPPPIKGANRKIFYHVFLSFLPSYILFSFHYTM